MKKSLAIILSFCILFIFSSCASNNRVEEANPYQVTEKRTNIKEAFNANEISKITVTIGGNETEIEKTNEILELLENANRSDYTEEKELSTIAAFIKIYNNEKSIDYGVIYLDNDSNAYISSNYNQNENAVLKIEEPSSVSKLIFPNMNLFN